MGSPSIQAALEAGTIYAALQPIVELRNQEIFAYEALVRCRDPSFPTALSIIHAAVETGFMGELGRAVRLLAVEACPDYPLFLNVHPSEFDQGFLVRPDDPIFSHAHDVFIEITESVPLSHFAQCHNILREIRSRGVHLAIDDLGAGYSNLKYIADLAPDVVKLDRALIAGMRPGSRLHTLARSLVELCAGLGATVVAEGIEEHAELSAVFHAGVQYGQGYLLARPAFPAPPARKFDIVSSGSRAAGPTSPRPRR